MKHKYFLPDLGETADDAQEFESGSTLPFIAVDDAAEHFWNERQGYESKWPIDFVVIVGGQEHTFEVRMELHPSFYALPPRGEG